MLSPATPSSASTFPRPGRPGLVVVTGSSVGDADRQRRSRRVAGSRTRCVAETMLSSPGFADTDGHRAAAPTSWRDDSSSMPISGRTGRSSRRPEDSPAGAVASPPVFYSPATGARGGPCVRGRLHRTALSIRRARRSGQRAWTTWCSTHRVRAGRRRRLCAHSPRRVAGTRAPHSPSGDEARIAGRARALGTGPLDPDQGRECRPFLPKPPCRRDRLDRRWCPRRGCPDKRPFQLAVIIVTRARAGSASLAACSPSGCGAR